MLFTQQLWARIIPIYDAIIVHPFNQALADGTLSREIFSFYIAQDAYYLKEFARALALIAARAQELDHLSGFLKFAQCAIVAESQVVHAFYRAQFGDQENFTLSPACLNYTNYLLKTCALNSVQVAMAAVLPCFWIYQQVGEHFSVIEKTNHPYERWLSTYGGEEYQALVNDAKAFTDQAAKDASVSMQLQMSDAFYTSSVLEWHFWNDAYVKRTIDDLTITEIL